MFSKYHMSDKSGTVMGIVRALCNTMELNERSGIKNV